MFDGIPPQPTTEPISLFRARREGAIATVRDSLGRRRDLRFDITDFLYSDACGTTVCFLGDLALEEYDGWRIGKGGSAVRVAPGEPPSDFLSVFPEAARYFGLSRQDANAIFGAWWDETQRYYGKPVRDITLDDVCEKLRAAPCAPHARD